MSLFANFVTVPSVRKLYVRTIYVHTLYLHTILMIMAIIQTKIALCT